LGAWAGALAAGGFERTTLEWAEEAVGAPPVLAAGAFGGGPPRVPTRRVTPGHNCASLRTRRQALGVWEALGDFFSATPAIHCSFC